jgi:hypothetical protein
VGKFSRNFELVRKHRDSSQFDTTVLWRIFIWNYKIVHLCCKGERTWREEIIINIILISGFIHSPWFQVAHTHAHARTHKYI